MRNFTADRAKRKFGALLDAAEDGPVAISRYGQRAYVLMPARLFDLYESLREGQEKLSIIDAAEEAVAKFLTGESDPAAKILGKTQKLIRELLYPPRRG